MSWKCDYCENTNSDEEKKCKICKIPNPEYITELEKIVADGYLNEKNKEKRKREFKIGENIKVAVIVLVLVLGLGYLVFGSLFRGNNEGVSGPTTTTTPQSTQTNSVTTHPTSTNFVRIPGGTFTMGSPANETGRWDGEGPQRQVTVSSFSMSRYPVTQREYEEIMGTNPSFFKGDNLPVTDISWFDAVEYCNRLSLREGLTPAYTINGANVTWNRNANGYRLPTEAEWEYACRAGTTTPFNTGNSITTDQANYDMSRGTTTPVGNFPPNAWGLYDMHGNVWEWCWDWYGDYPSGSQTDPTGAVSGSYRVMRGGSWGFGGQYLRSAYRGPLDPSGRHIVIGCRLVRP